MLISSELSWWWILIPQITVESLLGSCNDTVVLQMQEEQKNLECIQNCSKWKFLFWVTCLSSLIILLLILWLSNLVMMKCLSPAYEIQCFTVWNSANGHLVQLNLFIIVVFKISSCLVPLLFHWSDDELEISRTFSISCTCGIRKHNN